MTSPRVNRPLAPQRCVEVRQCRDDPTRVFGSWITACVDLSALTLPHLQSLWERKRDFRRDPGIAESGRFEVKVFLQKNSAIPDLPLLPKARPLPPMPKARQLKLQYPTPRMCPPPPCSLMPLVFEGTLACQQTWLPVQLYLIVWGEFPEGGMAGPSQSCEISGSRAQAEAKQPWRMQRNLRECLFPWHSS